MKFNGKTLARKMLVAMSLGIIVGVGFLLLREHLMDSNQASTWNTINSILFQDITAEGGEQAIGLFYLVGQLFVNCLQVIIVPMVFTSIALAICHISDTKKLGRISYKTILTFFITSTVALIVAGIIGGIVYSTGAFDAVSGGIEIASGSTASNPLGIIIDAVPNNIMNVLSVNNKVLGVVFIAVAIGLAMNKLQDKVSVLKKLFQEINDIITLFLNYVIHFCAPIGVFALLSRTFAIYGVDYLLPALAYVVTAIFALLFFLVFGYATSIRVLGGLNPIPFLKKIGRVAVFGFSTSSSAATLPLTRKTVVEELGVKEDIASFVLPLGMTINMDGTAIMQVVAAIFIAASAGYDITIFNVAIIAILALVASIGTPAAPGAGAIILFTVLTGMGYTNELALTAYSLILAINRPIEMVVTSLNVVGDAATSVIVAKSENALDEEVYHKVK